MTETSHEGDQVATGLDRPPPGDGQLVLREAAAGLIASRRGRGVAGLRSRLGDLSRNPAAVATATVGAGLAAGVIRQVLRSGALRGGGAAAPIAISVAVIHRVDVVHHVVHHVGRPALPPPRMRPF